jgi:hypothetical protein
VPGLLKFTARLLIVVFVISLRTGAYARVQDQTTCPLPGKPLNEESRFGWLEIVTGPLFVARRLHSTWKIRSNILSCARLSCCRAFNEHLPQWSEVNLDKGIATP